MRIIITGSRTYNDYWTLFQKLNAQAIVLVATLWEFPEDFALMIVHGDCPSGADRMVSEWVGVVTPIFASMGLQIIEERHPADWSLGRKAGPLRNKRMAESGADHCFAFWDGKSAGTKNMISNAERVGIPVTIILDQQA